MKIKVRVEGYKDGKCSTIIICLTEEDVKRLAEEKATEDFDFTAATAQELELLLNW